MEVTAPSTPSPIPASASLPSAPERAGPTGSSFAEVFRAVAERIDQGERLVAHVERAQGALDATRLLSLQAGVYRYSEAVELAAKLVDRMGNAIKTTLQGQ